MEKKWEELTPEEKRDARFQRWLDAEGTEFVNPEAEEAYKKRVTRLIKAIRLEKPDRVPCFLPAGFYPPYYTGGTLQDVMYDYDKLQSYWKAFRRDFDTDSSMGPGFVFPGRVFDRIDYKLMKWPGHGLAPESRSYQYIEGEYMKADEYDALINDPSDFWLRIMMPRIVGALEPFKYLNAFTPMSGIPMGFIMPFGRPDVQGALKALMDAGEELGRWSQAVAEYNREELALGYPPFGENLSGAPFDMIGDFLRGTRGIMMDMYRQPDKLHEAMEKITPMAIELAVAGADAFLSPIILMPLHKGDDNFMSDKQFETFYWPTLRKVIIGLSDEGLVPMLFAEGFYNRRMEYIKDVPRGAVIWWFESSDMALAKKVLGDTTCIAGNIPTSVLCTSTPQEVKEHCRKLIEVCGKGGGYILTGASSVEQTTPENLRAMLEAVDEYGVYK